MKKDKIVKLGNLGGVQGDVPILKVGGLSANGKITKERIVAFGEVTGHHHQIVGKCDVYEVERDIAGQLFNGFEVVVVEGQPVKIEHNSGGEHYAVEMAPGIYFIPGPGFQQVEYDGENERRVMD